MRARSITVSRVHRMVCNSHDNLNIKRVILQGRTLFWSAEYDYFDPILDMDEVLEFISPSHSGIEWLDGPQE